ncbi:probable F-box protein At4g22030 [Typha angustifolia]|uniref:probable F-box protein At4g22030 n=1 Tax=Typha angustifolia TaxID=59011 RepID=UPI003C2BA5D9
MATLRTSNLFSSSSAAAIIRKPAAYCRKSHAILQLPSNIRSNGISFPTLPRRLPEDDLIQRGEKTATKQIQLLPKTPQSQDRLLLSKLYAIADTVADRAEMHAIIGAQRNNWNHLFLHSINSMTLAASLMAGVSSITLGDASAPHALAFKLSSMLLFTAAAGMMLIVNKIQPSQLAEEQRNATRLWKQLGREIDHILGHQTPTELDVKNAMEKVIALEKAYPLPLLPGMLEKFPETVESTCWWPRMQHKKQVKGMGSNGWSKELEEEMKGVLNVLKEKDEEQYVRLGKLVLNINKTLAVSGPLLAGLAAIGTGFIGSSAHGPLVAIIGGVLAAAVNSLEHGGQIGMVFELFRNCGGFYRQLEEEIEGNLEEREVGKRENGELFQMKVALKLGRSLSELKKLASYASPSCRQEEIKEFAGKLF